MSPPTLPSDAGSEESCATLKTIHASKTSFYNVKNTHFYIEKWDIDVCADSRPLVSTSSRSVSPFFRDIGSTITSVKLQYYASTLCELITNTKNKNRFYKDDANVVVLDCAYGFLEFGVFLCIVCFLFYSWNKYTRVARASIINTTLCLYRTSRAFSDSSFQMNSIVTCIWSLWCLDKMSRIRTGMDVRKVRTGRLFSHHRWEGCLEV